MTHPLPWITPDPMQAVIESAGARELHTQLEQERVDYEWEKTPAADRPPFPPTYFPSDRTEPGFPPATGSLLGNAPRSLARVDEPPARGGAPVPKTSSREQ